MTSTAKILKDAKSIILTTHREPDGDGLGSQLALYFALQSLGKKVCIINVDKCADKYHFLEPHKYIGVYAQQPLDADTAVILDTNDKRLLSPLYAELEKVVSHIIFLDHHPVLEKGPKPIDTSTINTKAASTGEITYGLIQELGAKMNPAIAQALYTSIVFDTQMFRYIRNSPQSHLIAAELLKYDIDPEKIHRALFGDFTKNKLLFMAKSLNAVEFYENNKVAILTIFDEDLKALGLNKDHTKDIIDLIMNIDTIEAAALIRQTTNSQFKLSFRSKGKLQVIQIAENFGGGGHLYAAGAYVENKTLEKIKHDSLEGLRYALNQYGTKK